MSKIHVDCSEPEPKPADVLTPAELEREYKIGVGTQAALRFRKQIPYAALGGGRIIRYRRADIEAWMAERAVAVRK